MAAKSHRLSVNINDQSAEVLDAVTTKYGITSTEAVRRAIGLLALFEDAADNQRDIVIRDRVGNMTDRVLMSVW